MFIKKIISTALSAAMLFNFVTVNSSKAYENTTTKNIVIDGVTYQFEFDENMNIKVFAETSNCEATLILDENLSGSISIENDNKSDEEYSLKINSMDLESEEFNATLTDNNNIVSNVDYEDVSVEDSYEGQVAVAAGGTIVVGSLLSALLYACLAITIAGVICYAVSAVEKAVKKASNCYYKAYARLNTVFINPNPISKAQATNRIRSGSSIYTFKSGNARSAVVNAGLGVTKAEHHWKWYKIGDFYWHYHTANRNGAHAWYGVAI